MKNVHVLPTDKPSRLFKDDSQILNLNIHSLIKGIFTNGVGSNQHIYITNDEKIKEGKNYIGDGFSGKNKFKWHKSQVETYPNIKKDVIVLTTDPELIEDGVQAIDDDFLEWFVKNPSCEEVEVIPHLKDIINPLTNEKYPAVQHRHFDESKMIFGYHYEIIIPKEETKKMKVMIVGNGLPKQETLEEVAEKTRQESFICCSLSKSVDYVTVGEREKVAFIEGAKWQMGRSYTEEEVLSILYSGGGKKDRIKEWFEKFKKK